MSELHATQNNLGFINNQHNSPDNIRRQNIITFI